MKGEMYAVFLDGNYVGLAEDEFECADIAENANNGVGMPLCDDDWADRVWWEKINVNRWVQCEQALKCVEDKYTGKSILCSSITEVQEALNILNEADLERERAEAKIRALLL